MFEMLSHDLELANDHLTLSIKNCHSIALLAKNSVGLPDVCCAVHGLLQAVLLSFELCNALLSAAQFVAEVDTFLFGVWRSDCRATDVNGPVRGPFLVTSSRSDRAALAQTAPVFVNSIRDTTEDTSFFLILFLV